MNKPKAKGTKFESEIVKYLQAHGHVARRIALAGAEDCGDVYAEIRGTSYVIECKAYKTITPQLEQSARSQAVKESDNYQTHTGDYPCLPLAVMKQHGKAIGRSIVHEPEMHRGDAIMWRMYYLDEFIKKID